MRKLVFKTINFDGISYIAPNWEEMGKVVFLLGKQILETKKEYDWLISIAKGGWTWGRTLADYLNIDNLTSIKAKLYRGMDQTNKALALEQTLPKEVNIKNKKILLFDDVADSGKTLKTIKGYLLKQNVASVGIASLFYKPHSIIQPDFYTYQTSTWIIFPHELREFITITKKTWNKLPTKKVLERYQKLSLPENQVKYFYSLN